MFVRMLVRAAVLRRGRAASALLAMVVAAAAATAMLNLYVDVQAKLRREFRKYGANVVVVAREGQDLPQDALATARSALGNSGTVVPFAYAVARTLTAIRGRRRNRHRTGTETEHLVVGNRLAETAG
jgi:putative ABC transport system permease protein